MPKSEMRPAPEKPMPFSTSRSTWTICAWGCSTSNRAQTPDAGSPCQAVACDGVIAGEDEDRSEHRYEHAPKIEARDAVLADDVEQEAADERAVDAQDVVDDN